MVSVCLLSHQDGKNNKEFIDCITGYMTNNTSGSSKSVILNAITHAKFNIALFLSKKTVCNYC